MNKKNVEQARIAVLDMELANVDKVIENCKTDKEREYYEIYKEYLMTMAIEQGLLGGEGD